MPLIAYLTMLLNHMFDIEWIGIALPVFSYLIVKGYIRTSNKEKYVLRVIITGLISQFFWPFKEDTYVINDLLAIGITMLTLYDGYLEEILKVVIFMGWYNGIIAIEPLFLIIFAKEAIIYLNNRNVYYYGLIIFTVLIFPTYPYILRWLLVPIVIELSEKNMLTFIPRIKYKLNYMIYPMHLIIMKVMG